MVYQLKSHRKPAQVALDFKARLKNFSPHPNYGIWKKKHDLVNDINLKSGCETKLELRRLWLVECRNLSRLDWLRDQNICRAHFSALLFWNLLAPSPTDTWYRAAVLDPLRRWLSLHGVGVRLLEYRVHPQSFNLPLCEPCARMQMHKKCWESFRFVKWNQFLYLLMWNIFIYLIYAQ